MGQSFLSSGNLYLSPPKAIWPTSPAFKKECKNKA